MLADAEAAPVLEPCDRYRTAEPEPEGLTETDDAGERATVVVIVVGLTDADADKTGDATIVWLCGRVKDAVTGCNWDAVADKVIVGGGGAERVPDLDVKGELEDDGEIVGERETRGEGSLLTVSD